MQHRLPTEKKKQKEVRPQKKSEGSEKRVEALSRELLQENTAIRPKYERSFTGDTLSSTGSNEKKQREVCRFNDEELGLLFASQDRKLTSFSYETSSEEIAQTVDALKLYRKYLRITRKELQQRENSPLSKEFLQDLVQTTQLIEGCATTFQSTADVKYGVTVARRNPVNQFVTGLRNLVKGIAHREFKELRAQHQVNWSTDLTYAKELQFRSFEAASLTGAVQNVRKELENLLVENRRLLSSQGERSRED